MNYKKKIKIRLCVSICYAVIGAAIAAAGFIIGEKSEFLQSFGIAFSVMGIIRIIQYSNLLKTEESLKKREIAEKDERNIAIAEKARSMTFSIYICLLGIAILICQFMREYTVVRALAFSICLLVIIYYVCVQVFRRKM